MAYVEQRTSAAEVGMNDAVDPAIANAVSPQGTLAVRVTPKAAFDRIEVDPDGCIRVYVTAPPDKSKANKAVIALIAKALDVPKSSISLLRGATSRDKLLKLR